MKLNLIDNKISRRKMIMLKIKFNNFLCLTINKLIFKGSQVFPIKQQMNL